MEEQLCIALRPILHNIALMLAKHQPASRMSTSANDAGLSEQGGGRAISN